MSSPDKHLSTGITISNIILTIIGLVLFCVFLYGCFVVGKTASYSFFYEDMVQETIEEMVKPEYLKNIM